ncbi:hypothetical protein [Cellulomonas hominis]
MHDQLRQAGVLTENSNSLRDYIDRLYGEYDIGVSARKDETEEGAR